MSKESIHCMLNLLFVKAKLDIRNRYIDVLIKKLVARINSKRIAHKLEIEQLHRDIDDINSTLMDEETSHYYTEEYLNNSQVELNLLNKKIDLFIEKNNKLRQKLEAVHNKLKKHTQKIVQDNQKKLRKARTPLHKITNALKNYKPPGKQANIAQYKKLVLEIERVLNNAQQKE